MTAPAPEKAVRDPATGRYAHSGDLSRVCVCGHELGDHVHGGFECLGAGAPCACEKFCPATEKAAPIPVGVKTEARIAAYAARRAPNAEAAATIIARAIMHDRADRASQEERIRQDERDRLYAKAREDRDSSWPNPRAWDACEWLSEEGAMHPIARARQRGDVS